MWGERYIDELVCFMQDAAASLNANGTLKTSPTFATLQYALTDRNFSVIGMGFTHDTPGDRIRYEPYGLFRALPAGDVNGDGTVNSADVSAIMFAMSYSAELDLNMDGSINSQDWSMASSLTGRTLTTGQLSDSGNIVGWCGYLYEEATGMWLARHRWQIPELGRWANRDPIGYAGGGQNLYEYVNGDPVLGLDPTGLKKYNPCEKLWEDTGDLNKYLDCKQKQSGGTFRVGTMAGSSDASANIRRSIDETVETLENAAEFVVDTAGRIGRAIAESHAVCVAKCIATERLARDLAQVAINGALGALPGLLSISFDLYSDDWYVPNVGVSFPGVVQAATDPKFYDKILLNKAVSGRVSNNIYASTVQDTFFKGPLRTGVVGVAFAAGESAIRSTAKSIDYCNTKCKNLHGSEMDGYCGGGSYE